MFWDPQELDNQFNFSEYMSGKEERKQKHEHKKMVYLEKQMKS